MSAIEEMLKKSEKLKKACGGADRIVYDTFSYNDTIYLSFLLDTDDTKDQIIKEMYETLIKCGEYLEFDMHSEKLGIQKTLEKCEALAKEVLK